MPKGALQICAEESGFSNLCGPMKMTDEIASHLVKTYGNSSFTMVDINKDRVLMKLIYPSAVLTTDPVPQKPLSIENGDESDDTQAFDDDDYGHLSSEDSVDEFLKKLYT